jgi:hypothetical protein
MTDTTSSQGSLSPLKIVPAQQGAGGSFLLADLKRAIAEFEQSRGQAAAAENVNVSVQLPAKASAPPTGWGDPKDPTGWGDPKNPTGDL